MGSRVTLKDVAVHAGVSRATASLVVRGTGRIAQSTRDRVRAAMSELGYIYDHGAAALRTGRSGTVGIVVTNIASPYWGQLIHGLQHEFRAAGLLALLSESGDTPQAQEAAVDALRRHQVNGVVIIPAGGTDSRFISELDRVGLPYVLMARYVGGSPGPGYIGPDDRTGGRLAAEHLLWHGCASLGYVGGPASVGSRWDRISGVRSALDGTGARFVDVISETSAEGGRYAVEQLLASTEGLPDGIMCHNDTVAFGVMRELRRAGRTGIRVIGYDDIEPAELWEPPLTSVSTHGEELGRLAGRTLLQRMAQADLAQEPIFTTPELKVRQSCGCRSGQP